MDCANFAAVSALSHFRRPDVTVLHATHACYPRNGGRRISYPINILCGNALPTCIHLTLLQVVGDVVTVHSVDDRQAVPLALHHIPISVTFAFFTGTAPVMDSEHGQTDREYH